MSRLATSITITDPLVKYQSLVATGVCSPDLAQHRLAHHLQKVYSRLKDYTPSSEYRSRLDQLTKAIDGAKEKRDNLGELAVESHPIWRNPIFSGFFKKPQSKNSLALTKVLTSYQAALYVDSPKGLFLSGDVGTGKSMLLDLLAEGLPTSRKKRWHFNTFMLYAFSRLEQFRKSNPQLTGEEGEYSLLWLAKDLVEKSPVLFLDEFQLPDRAASKILNNLFIAFFQLGGVLVASSNRMPEELEKATGSYYSPPPTGGLFNQILGVGKKKLSGELYGQTSDFAAFLDVLKARCDFWHMEGARDWRRREAYPVKSPVLPDASHGEATSPGLLLDDAPEEQPVDEEQAGAQRPVNYFIHDDDADRWDTLVVETRNPWQPATLLVYGRTINIPRQHNGVCIWDFAELVKAFGPADYITLASTYHTFVIDNVPVLPMSMKNEARRFITFLDALYESRCKLIIRAEAGPDDLFFPETRRRSKVNSETGEVIADDAVYSETIAEVYQDQVSPFRPNIVDYSEKTQSKYNPDQDSDFGNEQDGSKKVDFTNAGAFTGEDERFAYARAASRLWEMCSQRWHEREGEWWTPLPVEARHWEKGEASQPVTKTWHQVAAGDVKFGEVRELEGPVGLERFSVEELRRKGNK
ncbi:hypothetical protein DL546_009774 [Coniochaeta pulveracea]|uniref:AAA+ ATPase domain-containing protein n=1 Tax=Coniochaeta pulveracea TaxID=177199 RepID=A0A420YP75_9PEZI|nr:hypothetical protein DL546_009774 [Coniochaeta pulveracea]